MTSTAAIRMPRHKLAPETGLARFASEANEERKADEARRAVGKASTRHALRFLEQVASDDRLKTGLAARVAIALAAFYNHEEGCARPSQETLANRVSATRNGVAKALDLLVNTGHIEVERGSGLGNFNRYRLLLWSQRGR